MIQQYLKLFAHTEWADLEVLAVLRGSDTIEPACLELFAHILGAEHVWLARLRDEKASVAVWPSLTLDQCAALAMENHRGFVDFIGRLAGDDDQRLVDYRNSAGRDFRSTIQDILLHVALHGAYHRGQIALAMRRGGVAPAPTDYIGFVRGSPAAVRQSKPS
ncbi:MAG: DinB family protein [Gemmatimonadota bacterium]